MKDKAEFSWMLLLPQYWPIWFGVGILRLIYLLPRKMQFAFGKRLGRFLHLIAGKRRQLALANVTLAFPELSNTERQNIVKQHFESLGISFIELATIWWGRYHTDDQNNESKFVEFKGLEHLREAEAKGKGVLVIFPHFTHIDTTNFYFSFVSPLMPVYRPNDNPVIDYLILKARTLGKRKQVNIPFNDTRSIIRALKKGNDVGFLPDQRYRSRGHIKVPFFGEVAKSHSSTSKIARMTDCSVLLMLTRRTEDRYQIRFTPVLEDFPSGDDYQDTLRLHHLYEEEIRQNPSQYLWVHNRWDLKWDKEKKAYIKKA